MNERPTKKLLLEEIISSRPQNQNKIMTESDWSEEEDSENVEGGRSFDEEDLVACMLCMNYILRLIIVFTEKIWTSFLENSIDDCVF